jgi:hypothetical protein
MKARETAMKAKLPAVLLAMTIAASQAAHAQSELSTLSGLSMLPLASVVVGASATASAAVALPVALSAAGAVLVVRAVQVTARGTVCVLERVSDGARASIEIVGSGAQAVSLAVGTTVTVSVVGAGVLLSAAGEVVAFLPNALGQALLHDERVAD